MRIIEWTEELPRWLRPVAYGPCLLLFLILARGGILILPLGAIYLIFFSKQPVVDLVLGLEVFSLLFGAAALGGLVHSLLGQRLARLPIVGPILAGIVDAAPYMAAVGIVVQLSETGQVFAPWDDAVYFTVGLLTLIFGPVIGWVLFHNPPE